MHTVLGRTCRDPIINERPSGKSFEICTENNYSLTQTQLYIINHYRVSCKWRVNADAIPHILFSDRDTCHFRHYCKDIVKKDHEDFAAADANESQPYVYYNTLPNLTYNDPKRTHHSSLKTGRSYIIMYTKIDLSTC